MAWWLLAINPALGKLSQQEFTLNLRPAWGTWLAVQVSQGY